MNREKQLEYCKKCIKQEFDMKQGIICSLTKQKANFEIECNDFEIDKSKIEAIKEKKANEQKSKIAYGFSPKQIDDIVISELSKKQAFVLALETAKKTQLEYRTCK